MANPWEEYQDAPWSQYAETKPATEGTRVAENLFFGKPKEKTFGERAGAVGEAAGLAGAASLAIPRVLQAIPQTKALGMALGTVGPFTRTALGSIAGAGSETAGQVAEMAGAPPIVSESARLAPLPVQAGIERGAILGAGKVGKTIRDIQKAGEPEITSEATRQAVAKLGGQGEGAPQKVMQVLEQQAAALESQIAQLRSAPVGREQEIAGIRQRAESQLASLRQQIAAKKQEMARSGVAGTRRSEQELQRALGTKMGLLGVIPKAEQRAETALSEAAGIRRLVGEPVDATEIGKPLRDRIVSINEKEIKQRSDNYKRDQQVRDDAVAQKESSGQFVTELPEYKAMLQDLRNKLLIGQTAQKQTVAPVTEAGVSSAYKRLYDALSMQRKEVGVNAEGNPIYKTFPPSFAAIDDVRRKMGDVAFGKEVEGYEGIGKAIAEDMYRKLSDIQSKFAGEPQNVLQGNYEAASSLLERFKGQRGRRALAIDKYNDSEYVTDPSKLPSTYFSTKGGVQDLIAMTGDKDLVNKAGREFAASQIAGMDSKALTNWMRKAEWVKELPSLESDLNRYRIALEKAEQVSARGEKTVKGVRQRIGREAGLAEQRQAGIEQQLRGERAAARGEIGKTKEQMGKVSEAAEKEVSEIEKETKKLRGERETQLSGMQQQADLIRGDPRPAERMQSLLLSASAPEELKLVADAIKANPEAMKAMPQVVRTLIANKVSPAKMNYEWRDSIRPLLEQTGVVAAKDLAAIDRDIETVMRTLDAQQRVTWLQNTIGKLLSVAPASMIQQTINQ
ncbi:MAG: hypothetical protein EBR82_47115 [Caulobacteraceae bacterium]|nr:hypothetical protein [Caulobacteraceae bacterium]